MANYTMVDIKCTQSEEQPLGQNVRTPLNNVRTVNIDDVVVFSQKFSANQFLLLYISHVSFFPEFVVFRGKTP